MKKPPSMSLWFKIGLAIVAVETVALTLLGHYYISRFSMEVDQKLRAVLEKPGEMMTHGLLNLSTMSDRAGLEKLVGSAVEDAMILGANGNVFHALDPARLGQPVATLAAAETDWLARARSGVVVTESREGSETFLTRISPIGVGEGRTPFLYAYLKVRTTEAEHEKDRLRERFILGSIATVVATSAALFFCLHFLVSRRLDLVAKAVERVAEGNYEARVGGRGNGDEVGRIHDGVDRMAGKLQLTIRSLEDSLAALRESEQRYRAVVTSAPVVIFTTDAKGIFTLSEGRGLQLLGLQPGQVVGQSVFEVYKDLPDIARSIRRALAGEAHKTEVDVQGVVFETWYAPILDGQQEVVGVIGVASDISARKQAEEERFQLEKQVHHAQKLESLGVLAGGIAHDFNNILTAILGHSELARLLVPDGSPLYEHLDEVQKAARRAADLARQMLAYSGKGRFVVDDVEVNEAVREMCGLLSVSITKKIELRLELAEPLPMATGDETQIRQVIMNLITNAAEAIGDNNGVVTVRTGVRHCDAACVPAGTAAHPPDAGWQPTEGPHVFIEVTDTGCGMDHDTLERIYEPFFTTKFTGRGLGLAVVLGIVRGHRGALSVTSQPGQGTTFTAMFPARETVPTDMGEGTAEEETVRWQGAGTVLLIDDEEALRLMGGQMLKLLGFEVVVAEDGIEAEEIFAASPGLFRCIVLDMNMPRRGGAESFRALRRIRPGVPVILSSGYVEQDVTAQFEDHEYSGFLHKPFTLGELAERLKVALDAA